MNKSTVLHAMGAAPPVRPVVLVEDQTVDDIMDGMVKKHRQCVDYYDDIAHYFLADDMYTTCKKLFQFCKKSFEYKIETLELQRVSTPVTMLNRGEVDCKNYSLFIGGVLDALKRMGEPVEWCFRFVSQNLLSSEKHHVFVVVNPKGENIWVDPVMNNFDVHPFYWYKKDKYVRTASCVGRIGAMSVLPHMQASRTRENYRVGSFLSVPTATQVQSMATSAQTGAYYGQAVFNNQNLIPSAGAAFLQSSPVTYWLNGQQLLLPPQNTVPGSAVPPLPVGLVVKYAPSFMGYPIPSNMPVPVVKSGNVLQWSCAVNAPGCVTSAQLLANNKILLNILMSAMGPLINSYSSYPYANGFDMLSNDILTKSSPTSKANMLNPDDNQTLAGEVLTDVGNTVLPIVAPVVGLAVSAVATPAAGAAAAAALEGIDSVLNQAETSAVSSYGGTTTLPATNPASVPQTVPGTGSTFSLSNLTSLSISNPLLWLLGAGALYLILKPAEK
jgi:hypothetical protein